MRRCGLTWTPSASIVAMGDSMTSIVAMGDSMTKHTPEGWAAMITDGPGAHRARVALVKRIQSEVRAEIIAYINLIADDYHKAEHVMQAGIVRYVAQAVQRNVGAK